MLVANLKTNPNQMTKDKEKIDLCSNCFTDEGLKIDAYRIGIKRKSICPNCKSKLGNKLTKKLIEDLCYRFFVRGTIHRFEYGGFPLIQFNEYNFNQSSIDVSPWLENDVKLIENTIKIGLFYYGPRFWMFGEIEPLKSLQNEEEKKLIIKRILKTYPIRNVGTEHYFYRIRLNPETPHNFDEYDSPPDNYLGKNRFDDFNFPILYGSPDLELCIHECRTTVEDEIYLAKLSPIKSLKLLDLTFLIEEDTTEFESLDMAIHFLFLAGKHSYQICREIAFEAKKEGFDGIIFPSYFSFVKTGHIPFDTVYGISIRRIPELKDYAQSQSIPNIALFGRPVKENKVLVHCVNKVLINKVEYDISFGPAYHKAFQNDTE